MTFPSRDVAELIVCERDGRWAMRLRRMLAANRVRIRETRSLCACREALELARSSMLVVEWTASNASEAIDFVADVNRMFARAVILLAGDPTDCDKKNIGSSHDIKKYDVACFRWLAIEAGAATWVASSRELSRVVPLIQTHLNRVATTAVTTHEQIIDSLPWSKTAAEINPSR